MTSSKKKRGKERKAKKQVTANSNSCNANNSSSSSSANVGQWNSTMIRNAAADFLAFLRIGCDFTTKQVIEQQCHNIMPAVINEVFDDTLAVVLGFLQRCEDETLVQVMANKSGRTIVCRHSVVNGVGGNLKSPSTWVKVLAKLVSMRPSCMLHIVDNVGPLIRCMCNDTERLFFGSNEHWGDSILPFVRLISNILRDQPKIEKKDVIDAVFLQHEGLLRRIVQWGFWDEHRPDIVREKLGQDDCMSITTLGRKMTQRLVSVAGIPRDDARSLGAANRVKFIASTPIVSHYYDPNCMTSYWMRYMKTTGDVSCMFELETLIIDSLDFVSFCGEWRVGADSGIQCRCVIETSAVVVYSVLAVATSSTQRLGIDSAGVELRMAYSIHIYL